VPSSQPLLSNICRNEGCCKFKYGFSHTFQCTILK
jgi:hypothetical protein